MIFRSLLYVLPLSLVFLTPGAHTEEAKKAGEAKKNKLQVVMQDLSQDAQAITHGIATEDYDAIYAAAKKIASHPGPGLSIQLKLLKNIGGDLPAFKDLDAVVHDQAVALQKSSRDMDMGLITEQYKAMLDGCHSCHTRFKSRISAILNK